MKIYQSVIFNLVFLLIKSICKEQILELMEDEELINKPYKDETTSNTNSDEIKIRMDNVKSNIGNLGYDFSKAIKVLYSNYSNIEIKVQDIDYLYQKGIINDNQAIMIWESLLNSKTERNLEWLGYNKLIKKDQKESIEGVRVFHNFLSLFNNQELKFNSYFAYFGGPLSFYLMKIFLKYPKLNMLFVFIMSIANIMNSFYFYSQKCYFTSFLLLASFISNIYFFYLSLVKLTGHKTIDYSIFHTKHFKTKEHFLIKVSICTFIIIILTYISSFAQRYFLNYLLTFYFIEINRDMIKQFCKPFSPKSLQPFDSFLSVVIGVIIFLFAHSYYYAYIYYSYDLNSFLIFYNLIILYYCFALENFIYVQRNRLGDIYLECEKISDNREKHEFFEEAKKKINLDKNLRNESFHEGNLIDLGLMILCGMFLTIGFYLNTYFYLYCAIFILYLIHKYCLIFLTIKISRIISNIFLLLFLLTISNLDPLNYSYINEIIAVYDQKFLEALLLLFKLIFLATLAICNYFSEDFVDMFNIYNYSSYKYLSRETKAITNNLEMTKRLNEIYTIRNVLIEILEFDLSSSLESVNNVLDSINTSGSNIDGFYIEYLLTKNTSDKYVIPLLIDYILIYASIWILFDTFRNNNHSFFYLTSLIHKIGLFSKLVLLTFEYSKTNLQKNILVVLNMIFMMRLFNYPELDEIEKSVVIIFFFMNVFTYIKIYKNNVYMNAFIIFFSFEMLKETYRSSVSTFSSLLFVAMSIGSIVAKNIIHLLKLKHFKMLIYFFFSINSFFLIQKISLETILFYHQKLRVYEYDMFKVDMANVLEQMCFNHNGTKESINLYLENQIIFKFKEIIQIIKNYNF